ncbi:MAG: molybdenum cofactor biosynthesis protein MoaE [Robiginitomaculum sp.]|nr:MAG: molybdenum cofactor biosynthesis protein MoaE [Robiginitomaculum sp.]
MPENIGIYDTPFDPTAKLAAFTQANSDAGAITSFLGQVRNEAGSVSELYLESYPGVTEAGITKAVEKAKTRWSLTGVMVIHRTGAMSIGEPIVLVATAAKHRRAAFESCDYLMDYLKTEAVFWKRQKGADGTQWIEPRDEDYKDNKRWSF